MATVKAFGIFYTEWVVRLDAEEAQVGWILAASGLSRMFMCQLIN